MTSRYEAWMDGVALSSMHDELMILDIQHTPPQRQATTARKAKGNGAYVSNIYQSQTTVTILFELHIYSITERQRICQDIASWAMNGDILRTNDRPGQRLHVTCDQPPAIESALQWTAPISIVFSAYALPFWEESDPVTLTLTGTNANGTLTVPGNAGETFVDAEITASDTLTALTLTAKNTTITLTDLNVAAGGVVRVTHDENGILSIKYDNISILRKRTAASSDDLLVTSGKTNPMSVSADASVSCVLSVRGVWL